MEIGFLGAKATNSFVIYLSVHLFAWYNSDTTVPIFVKVYFEVFFIKICREIVENTTKISALYAKS